MPHVTSSGPCYSTSVGDTLPFTAHGSPEGCLPVWCHHGFGDWALGWPQSRGRLTRLIPQVPHRLVFGPSFRGPVSLWILLWALLPAFPSFSLTPSRNVCAQQSGKQETARSIMLGNIHYCSKCLSIIMSQGSGYMSQRSKKVISCPRGRTDQVDPASESSSGPSPTLYSSVEAQQKPWLIYWDFLYYSLWNWS